MTVPTTAPSAPRFSRGSTLIGLLVVIAIVALPAALILPVFAKVRELARQAICLSNLRQVGLGILMYADDADNHWPLYFSGMTCVTPGSRTPGHSSTTAPPYQYWPELISSYVQTQTSHNPNSASKVFVCPDAPYDAAAISTLGISNTTSYRLSDNWAEWYCPNDCNNGTRQVHSFSEAVATPNTVPLAETLNNTDDRFPGASLAQTPVDGANTGYSYAACDSPSQPAPSPAREFLNLSWRHQ